MILLLKSAIDVEHDTKILSCTEITLCNSLGVKSVQEAAEQ